MVNVGSFVRRASLASLENSSPTGSLPDVRRLRHILENDYHAYAVATTVLSFDSGCAHHLVSEHEPATCSSRVRSANIDLHYPRSEGVG